MKPNLNSRALVWVAAALTFALFGFLTGFFTFGKMVPMTTDMNPGLYSQIRYSFPPQAEYALNYWLGQPIMPQDLNPMSLLAWLPAGLYFSGFYPLMAALALVAAYAFLRELGFRRGVALFGGILYAWQGDLFSNLIAGHFSAATVWFLFALAAYCCARSAKTGSWLASACCGVSLGMMVSVLPDRGALCSALIGGFYLVEIARRWAVKAEALRHAGRLLLTILVAVAVAAPGVFATVSTFAVKSSAVGADTPQQKYEWATQWSYTPEDAINYFIPGFMGWRNGHDTGPYWGRIGQTQGWKESQQGMRNFCLAIFTIGTTGLVVALIGAVLVGTPFCERPELAYLTRTQIALGRFCVVVLVIGWLLSLGKYGPLYEYFFHLPYMDTWRNPLKFLAPLSLALVLLAACGAQVVAALLDHSEEKSLRPLRRSVGRVAGWLSAVLIGAIVLSFPARLPGTVWLQPLGYSEGEIAAIFSTLRTSLVVALVCVGLWYWLWRLLTGPVEKHTREFINPWIQRVWNAVVLPENWGRSWLALLGAVTILQMGWVHTHYADLFNLHQYYGSTLLLDQIKSSQEMPHRISADIRDPLLRQLASTVFPYHKIQVFDIPAASRIPNDYDTFFKSIGTHRARLWQLTGTRDYLTPMSALASVQEDPDARAMIEAIDYIALEQPGAPSHAIVRFKNYLPKAALIPRLEMFAEESELLKRLVAPDWNPLASVLVLSEHLPKLGESDVAAAKPDAAALKKLPSSVKLTTYSGRRIEVEVESPTAAYLVIDDRFDRDWKATVNGKPAAIFPADFILRGVAVPAGKSKVVMTYALPMPLYYVQLAVLAVVAAWGLASVVVKQRDVAPTS